MKPKKLGGTSISYILSAKHSYLDQTSQTLYDYVDTAGFEDTSGVETEIVNSYALSELFKAGSKVKLAIVITEDSLVAKRGGDLSKIFQRVS